MLNPDGVVVGNYRTSLAGLDLNRVYRKPSQVKGKGGRGGEEEGEGKRRGRGGGGEEEGEGKRKGRGKRRGRKRVIKC